MAQPTAYLRIRPTTESIPTDTVTASVQRLHQLLQAADAPDPAIEWLLFTRGADEGVEYYLGGDPELEMLERVARELFPNTYELTRTTVDLSATLLDASPDPGESDSDSNENEVTSPESARELHAVEFRGHPSRPNDWQTCLTPFHEFREDERTRVPLNAVLECLAAADQPAAYQVLVRPRENWDADARDRRIDLELNEDTRGQKLVKFIGIGSDSERLDSPRPGETDRGSLDATSRKYSHLGESVRRRLDHLADKDTAHSFDVYARAIAVESGTRTLPVPGELEASFASLGGPFYDVVGHSCTGEKARELAEDVCASDTPGTRWLPRISLISRSPSWTVADPAELPSFCLLDGGALSTDAARAIDRTPAERSAVDRPAEEQLEPYRTTGLTLGRPLTQDDEAEPEPISLSPSLQPLHLAWVGKTGSGKSTSLVNAILENSTATDGADILIDPKGDGMPLEYLRAHYAEHGSLENVYYFDCAETLPALSFFDIREELEEGLDRGQLVQNLVDHYVEILIGIMGRDRFEQAVRSPDIIRYLVKAQFDPVHGYDAFSHRMLQWTARRLHETREPPAVSDEDLESKLGGIAANSKRSFDELMQGVANRIEKVTRDDRLNRLFNHVPDRPGDYDVEGTPTDPTFDFHDLLNEDAVVVIDTGGLRSESQRILTLVLLSNLWTALKRRAHRRSADGTASGDAPPLVNLYLEEAPSVANSEILSDLLAQSRGFGLSVTLAMQFPGQLRSEDADAYAEVLNNVSTIVTGNVAVDRDLAERLATVEMGAEAVGARLRALRRGQWLVSLPAPFGESEPRPFLLESAPLPPGDPDGSRPLSEFDVETFELLQQACTSRTRLAFGLPASRSPDSAEETSRDRSTPDEASEETRVDSALPYTKRFPAYVTYEADAHAISCDGCASRYDATIEGMRAALSCCGALDRVDRDDVPICELGLTLSPAERRETGYTHQQLLFLQAVYRAHQRQFDTELEYDLLRDSMTRLKEYLDVDEEAVHELLDDDVLSHDGNHPHKLYTVTAEGRSVLHVAHREGVAYGDGKGDLGESSLHVLMVEVGRRHLEETYVEDSSSSVTEAVSYHEVDGFRLDVAGLDQDGEVVIAFEAERSNHDTRESVPSDYDKMKACSPEEAVWMVPNRETAHEVLGALNDPLSGLTRVEAEYSKTVPPARFSLDSPGCTRICTLRSIQRDLSG